MCTLTASSNSRLTVKGNLTHNGDTLLVRVPASRQLKEGDELTVFNVQGSHTGSVIVKVEADDGSAYEFDTASLLTDGIIRVVSVATAFSPVTGRDAVVSVYSIDGVLLRPGVPYSRALDGLPRGTYIVNGKIVIK